MAGELEEAPFAALDALYKGIQRPIQTLDWREFDFFKDGEGLSKWDLLEIRICLDYERARESQEVIDHIAFMRSSGEWPKTRVGRFVPVPFQNENELTAMRPVPAVCLEADWFPSPWLSGFKARRSELVSKCATMYETPPLCVFDFPLASAESRSLEQAVEDGGVTLHVIAVDRAQPRTAVVEQFKSWLRQQSLTARASRRGKVKSVAQLRDLACYRLMKRLDSQARTHVMQESGFRQSVPKLSQAARRAAAQLRKMRYIR